MFGKIKYFFQNFSWYIGEAYLELKYLFKRAFLKNQWLWFHCIAGAILGHFFGIYLVAALALFWEYLEFVFNRRDLEKIYGSKKDFFYDAIGDVLGAVLCSI